MPSPPSNAPRKGARRRADIPPPVLEAITQGEQETRTLVEGLAVDFRVLMRNQFPDLPPAAIMEIDPFAGYVERGWQAARVLLAHYGIDAFTLLRTHRSDLVRGWAAGMVGLSREWTFVNKLAAIRPLADDPNPHVREWAWLFLRPTFLEDPCGAIDAVAPWTADASPNIRRYASELTRPRGVWCRHCDLLKEQPHMGRPVLDPLRADTSHYVQDSVGNWLNDAAKTRPDFVKAIIREWQGEPPAAPSATDRIARRALRSIKGGDLT